jgi:hypothetical protein
MQIVACSSLLHHSVIVGVHIPANLMRPSRVT